MHKRPKKQRFFGRLWACQKSLFDKLSNAN